MYRLVFLLSVIVIMSCNQNSSKKENQNVAEYDSINNSALHFYTDTLNLGEIKEGERVNCIFRFKNEGKTNILISSVSAGCGCTSTEWDHEPIKPGQESEIKVVFNSKGRSGKQVKSIFVNSNAQKNEKVLKFSCFVISSNKS